LPKIFGVILKIKDKKVRSLPELLKMLAKDLPTDKPVWFRGQADKKWSLQPSLFRKGRGLNAELTLMKRFKQSAFGILPKQPQTEWEWLLIMQHYGVPTRLLDWTESPLVGIYFAVYEKKTVPGVLWALLPVELNLAANFSPKFPNDIPGFGDDDILNNYFPSVLASESQTELKPIGAMAVLPHLILDRCVAYF